MSTSYSRTFLHLFARLHVRPAKLSSSVELFAMKDALQDLLKEHQRSRLVFSFPGAISRGVVLLDHRVETSGAVLLIACADRGIPDPTMLNIATSQTESFGARDGFSWAYSAHLLLSFTQTDGGDYPTVLEVMPRLSRTSVVSFLNRSFKRDPYEVEGDKVWPEIEFSGDISNRLRAAIQEGKLRGVDLLQQCPADKLGVGESGLTATRETLSLHPDGVGCRLAGHCLACDPRALLRVVNVVLPEVVRVAADVLLALAGVDAVVGVLSPLDLLDQDFPSDRPLPSRDCVGLVAAIGAIAITFDAVCHGPHGSAGRFERKARSRT